MGRGMTILPYLQKDGEPSMFWCCCLETNDDHENDHPPTQSHAESFPHLRCVQSVLVFTDLNQRYPPFTQRSSIKEAICPYNAYLESVLAHSGCYNTPPQTGWLISNRNLFLKILEAGSLRSGHQHSCMKALFQITGFLLYPHPHLAEGARELCGVSFIRALIPLMRAPPPWPWDSQVSSS